MGVHISLCRIGKKNGKAWTGVETYEYLGDCSREFGWDGLRMAGDREMSEIWGEADYRMISECDGVSRPLDIEFARQAMLAQGFNEDRWNLICDVLRDNPDVWVYFGW